MQKITAGPHGTHLTHDEQRMIDAGEPLTVEKVFELRRAEAVARTAMKRLAYPELSHRVAAANMRLVAAIIALDDVEERIMQGEPIHSLHEQAEVEAASADYRDELADLVRA